MGNGQELKKVQSYFTKTKTLTFPDIQLEEDFTPVDNIKSQNCSSVSHIGAENVQCSSNSTAIPYASLTADEEPAPETKDDCSHCTSFLPSTSVPLKSEDNHAEVFTPVKSEDKIEGSSIWITHDGRHTLQENDRLTIQQGGELTDKHISFAQNTISTDWWTKVHIAAAKIYERLLYCKHHSNYTLQKTEALNCSFDKMVQAWRCEYL